MIDRPKIEIIPKGAAKELVKETAQLTREVGYFFGKVFGSVPQDFVGVIGGDWLHEIRERNLYQLKLRTEAIKRERSQTSDLTPLSPSEAIPLLRAAADESRPELQELWARLLANATDPQRPATIKILIDVLKELDVLEGRILKRLSDENALNAGICFLNHAEKVNWRRDFQVSSDPFTLALDRMGDLKIMNYELFVMSEEVLSSSADTAFSETYFGASLAHYFSKFEKLRLPANLPLDYEMYRGLSNARPDPSAFFGGGLRIPFPIAPSPFASPVSVLINKLMQDEMAVKPNARVVKLANFVGIISIQTLGRELLRSISLDSKSSPPRRSSRRRRGLSCAI
jgi:hypothetical protein